MHRAKVSRLTVFVAGLQYWAARLWFGDNAEFVDPV